MINSSFGLWSFEWPFRNAETRKVSSIVVLVFGVLNGRFEMQKLE